MPERLRRKRAHEARSSVPRVSSRRKKEGAPSRCRRRRQGPHRARHCRAPRRAV